MTVDFDMGLNRCIRRVRAALMDDADAPRYLETLPKTGYRFIAPVKAVSLPESEHLLPDIAPPVAETTSEESQMAQEALSEQTTPAPKRVNWGLSHIRWRSLAIGGLLALFLLAAVAIYVRGNTHGIINAQFTLEPLANGLGVAATPSFSPGGQQIAFSWNGEKQDNFDIYVKMVGSPALVRVTNDSQVDFSPAWSPDGRFIAFCRGKLEGGSAIWITSPLGGPERKIIDLNAPAEVA